MWAAEKVVVKVVSMAESSAARLAQEMVASMVVLKVASRGK